MAQTVICPWCGKELLKQSLLNHLQEHEQEWPAIQLSHGQEFSDYGPSLIPLQEGSPSEDKK